MKTRVLANQPVSAVGLGCMNLSHAYGAPPAPEDAAALLLRAVDLGVTHFDTAALYGFGVNEALVGRVLKPRRTELFVASKCGMTGVNGRRVIDGRPATIRQTCEDSLSRLQTDYIDLYYLHRWDKSVPIEDSVGEMAALMREGKIRALGLSEVSAATLLRAHAAHPIAAVQSEYSLFSRNVEIAVLDACRDIGATFVAFSPLARGLLCGGVPASYAERDIRRAMPRFNPPHLAANLALALEFANLARARGVASEQLALAWLLHRAPNIVVIPGTTSTDHLQRNCAASDLTMTEDERAELDRLFDPAKISGDRYPASTQAEIDTEQFAA